MAPIRVRHPKGVSTIDIDLENATVLDLQQAILKLTEILPSQQEIKSGYPPQSLALSPEASIQSLELKRGEQIIVNKISEYSTTNAYGAPISASAAAAHRPNPNPPTKTPALVSASKPKLYTPPPPQPIAPPPSGPDSVQTPSGTLVHRVVPDDNSCLFSAIGILFEQDMGAAQKLRKVAAQDIKDNMETYSEAVLGMPRDNYISTILRPTTWGGAIELSLFSTHYNAEIASIDVETGRIDRFGEGKYDTRAILLYSGIHYDAVSLSPIPDAPPEFHTTLFPVGVGGGDDGGVLKAAGDLATKLRAKKKFTNTATFDLKCEVCGIGLKGEKEARVHAGETGHTDFGEY